MGSTSGVPDGGARDHSTWRPEWRPDRRCAYWYLSVPGDGLADPGLAAAERLVDRAPWLDVVPRRWWHLTLCDVGFDDDLGHEVVQDVARVVAEDVASSGSAPLEIGLGPLVAFRTAVVLPASPEDRLRDLQQQVRGATQRVLGPGQPLVRTAPVRPHVSLGYVNRDVPPADVQRLVEQSPEPEVTLEVDHLVLAQVARRDRHYQWEVLERVPVGAVARATDG